MFRNATVAAALLGLALAATPALADEATRVRVEYKDLDLTTPQGQRTLEQRLNVAARSACGMDLHTTGSRLASPQARACYKQATERAKDVMASAIDNAASGTRMGG